MRRVANAVRRQCAKPRSKEMLRVSYQIEGMQHASFVRSGAPWFTYDQQILIEQKSTTLCTAPAKIRPHQNLV
jgi:hypothetical protein